MLSELQVRNTKADPTRTIKLSDGGGLQLWVTPTGSKLWQVAYRFDAKQKKLSLGPYPALGLAAARAQRDEARRLLALGTDPGQHRKAEAMKKASAEANTFDVVADELLTKKGREQLAAATIEKVTWLVGLARPRLGKRPIAAITAPEILDVLRVVEGRGRHETARRLRATISEVFRHAVATGRATIDPTYALRGVLAMPKTKHRSALTDPKAFGGLLRAIDGYEGSREVRIAMQVLALTFVRPGELRAATWSEIDLATATWTIPGPRMKMRHAHRVPLAPQAIAILEELRGITGGGKLLFPSVRSASRPMSEGTLGAALRRLGYTGEDHTPHGFRAVASTMLNESGSWSADAIELQLAHADADQVRRAYHRSAHWPERVAMMAAWADRLEELRKGGKVIALRA